MAGMCAQALKPPRPQALTSPSPQALKSSDGFTLFETLIATGILVTALAGIAQLFALSVRSTRDSGSRGLALLSAQTKLEMLRALELAYGPAGEMVTDPSLEASPASSLHEDTAGYVDLLDAAGAIVTDGAGGVFIRRWAITPIDLQEPQAAVIEVCVFRAPADGVAPVAAEACLATIRSRQP